MYKLNQHLKKINGNYILPDSFKYCTGKVNHEFYAWWDNGDIVIETTIIDKDLLCKKIKRWEQQEKEKLLNKFNDIIEIMNNMNVCLDEFVTYYNSVQESRKKHEKY